ncbi:MAG: glycosyltransferase family 39 protein [Candidatus Omnitrophota bacterium]
MKATFGIKGNRCLRPASIFGYNGAMLNKTLGRHAVLLSSSAVFAYFFLYYTSYFGVGLAPDSLSYLSMAFHLEAGRGMSVFIASQHVRSEAVTGFSPLYPFLLTGLLKIGLSAAAACWILNNLILFINLYLMQALTFKVTGSYWLALMAAALCAANLIFTGCHTWVLAEGLLILLVNLSLLLFLKALETGNRRALLSAAVLLGLSTLAKYIGFAYAFAWGLCLLIYWKGSFGRRLAHAFGFGAVAIAPMCLWLVRNYLVDHTPGRSLAVKVLGSLYQHDASGRIPFWRTTLDSLEATGQWVSGFVSTGFPGPDVYPIIAAVVLFLMLKGAGASRNLTPQPDSSSQKQISCLDILWISCVVYYAILLLSLSTSSFSVKIPGRYLITCFMHLTIITLALIQRGFTRLELPRRQTPIVGCWVLILTLCLAGLLSGFAVNLGRLARQYATKGVDRSYGESWSYTYLTQWFPHERKLRINPQW